MKFAESYEELYEYYEDHDDTYDAELFTNSRGQLDVKGEPKRVLKKSKRGSLSRSNSSLSLTLPIKKRVPKLFISHENKTF